MSTPRVAVLAAFVLCTGCATPGPLPDAAGTTARAGEPAATHDHPAADAHVDASFQEHELPATAGPGYTAADVRFMQHMIGHHAQALTMVAMAPTHGAGERLLQLAEKIDISQRDEIDFMTRWLVERGQAVPDEAHAHAMRMPGMLTAEQLAQLDASRGVEFERLFLTFMIQHHEGALQMVEALFASPGAGQDSDIFRFATDVDADQRDEIFVMQSMIDMLDTARGSQSR